VGIVTRERLLARYRELVLGELPRRARAGRWVVTADHCFGRIVLDHAVGGRWYDVLDRRRPPAFAQLDDDQLATAVALAERVVAEGDPLLRELDAQSLAWRGKPAKR
jgi:proline racemase